MKVISKTGSLKEWEGTTLLDIRSFIQLMKECFRTVYITAMDESAGRMVIFILENLRLVKKKVLEFINLKTATSTLETTASLSLKALE